MPEGLRAGRDDEADDVLAFITGRGESEIVLRDPR